MGLIRNSIYLPLCEYMHPCESTLYRDLTFKQFYVPPPVWSWVYRFDKQFYLPPPVWIHGFDEEDSGFLLDGIQGFHQEIGKTHPLWSHVIHSISPALGSLQKRQTQYSKTFLIWHLCNPFPCVIGHWIFPIWQPFCVLALCIPIPCLFRHKIPLPEHGRLDRGHCTIWSYQFMWYFTLCCCT